MNDARTAEGLAAHQERDDRSVPRSRVRRGDTSIDRRGRRRAAPAILSYGFRPFFLGASVYAAAAIPLWLWMLRSGIGPAGPFTGVDWHAHEMIFGYLGAVMAGFILTAVPNWTGPAATERRASRVALRLVDRRPRRLFDRWLARRGAVPRPGLPCGLSAAVWREVLVGRTGGTPRSRFCSRSSPPPTCYIILAASGRRSAGSRFGWRSASLRS